ncbi:MAG: DUF2807 domain-containing protein [Bacteroidales bacterium]|nr:DUF2807 domain-containing protein [Bacteroidales bacterium]
MRNTLFIFTAFLLALFTASAVKASAASDPVQTKVYHFSADNTGLRVSSSFSVEIVKGRDCKVELEYSSSLADYIEIEESRGVVVLSMKNTLKSTFNARNRVLRAKVTIPALDYLKVSGAADVISKDEFVTNGEVSVEVSGAGDIKDLIISGDKVRIQASGAADVDMTCRADVIDLRSSGAADIDIVADCDKMNAQSSGASDIKVKGEVSESLDVECSGSSSFKALDVPVNTVDAETSGSSSCRINVLRELTASASGASSIRYHAAADANIRIENVSRAASVRKL